jgi:hypothetical protein
MVRTARAKKKRKEEVNAFCVPRLYLGSAFLAILAV